jgi:hypothetical protein
MDNYLVDTKAILTIDDKKNLKGINNLLNTKLELQNDC